MYITIILKYNDNNSIHQHGEEYLWYYYYVVVFFSSVPSVDSSIPVTIEQNVTTSDMVEITVLVNVSNKPNYV